jgi:hypothetical protein
MITILIAAYLIIGAFSFVLIWIALIASKQRNNKAKDLNHERIESVLLRESHTKPSSFRP